MTGEGACADLARRILDACDCAVPGVIAPHELERHVRGDLPPVRVYDKVDDFAARDREHQLKGAAARAEIRAGCRRPGRPTHGRVGPVPPRRGRPGAAGAGARGPARALESGALDTARARELELL